MNILQVNYYDNLGGAARIAWLLHRGYREQGHNAWMAAGIKLSEEPYVKQIPPTLPHSFLGRLFYYLAEYTDKKQIRLGSKNLAGLFRRIADPIRYYKRFQGFEDFNFPGSRLITSLPEDIPQIVHLHNLHLNYFDLTTLPELSRNSPVVMTLHDMWPLTGHCAHGMECQRWKIGCGECPQLEVYPAMSHDQTAFNWQRKRDIYAHSSVYVTGPSKWMVDTAQQSMLAPAIKKKRVIPNGIDLNIFCPGSKQEARKQLGLPLEESIMLFVSAGGIKRSSFKDYSTIQDAIRIVAQQKPDKKILFIALGDRQSVEKIGNVEIRSVAHVDSAEKMALYYRAVDLYLHASKAESFGLVLIEAQACGTPVIATSVGGIPDTIMDGETGFLTRPMDAHDMANRIMQLLEDKQLGESMSHKASRFVSENFGVERMVNNYLSFYQEILDEQKS